MTPAMPAKKAQGAHRDQLLQGDGGHHAGEGTHAHKAGVAQAQLAGDAHHQVQCHSHGDIGTDGDQLPLKGGGEHPAGIEKLKDHKGGSNDAVGEEIAEEALAAEGTCFHIGHLTLSRAHTCPAVRRA